MADERFTPEMTANWTAAQHGIKVEDFGVAKVVVIGWSRRVIQSLAAAAKAQMPEHWMYGEQWPLYTGEIDEQIVSFVHLPVGASGTVMIMEEMVACGARVFLGFGWAGGLRREASIGTLLIPTTCIREEGTSLHYLGPEQKVESSPRLIPILEEACAGEGAKVMTGPVWTTDAPYRETLSKVNDYAAKGVVGVDMETSAMYALGIYRHVEVCNLLVISDELWGEWKPAFGSKELEEAGQLAERVIMRCLKTKLADLSQLLL